MDAASRLTLDGSAALLDGRPFSGPIIYTGAADELFGCKYGRLPYRTLDFRFETHPVHFWQSHGTVNYTVDQDYTRITEFKYLTGQELPGQTTIMKEYSRAFTGAKGRSPTTPSSTPGTTPCTPNTGRRRTAIRISTCWAGWRSTNTTTWTPSPHGRWSCVTTY